MDLKSARIVDLCGKSSGFADFENTGGRGSAVIFDTDYGLRLIHGAILRAMAELHHVSTPKFVARNVARNIAAVESHPTSATLRATNFFVYPPSAAFRAIV